jgi:hypothetical protein
VILTPQRSTKNQLKSSMQAFARSPAIVRLVGNDKLMQLLLRAGVAALDEESAQVIDAAFASQVARDRPVQRQQ